MPIHVGVVCSKSLWERVDGFDERYKISSDYDFLLKSFYAGSYFILDDAVLGEMRAGVCREKNYRFERRLRNSLQVFWCSFSIYHTFKRIKIYFLVYGCLFGDKI